MALRAIVTTLALTGVLLAAGASVAAPARLQGSRGGLSRREATVAPTGARLPRYGPIRFVTQSTGPGSLLATGSAIATADFNGDGLPDVAVARAVGGTPSGAQDTFPLGVLLSDGRGHLRERPARVFVGAPPRTQSGRQLLVADFNNDGRPDIFLPDTGPEAVNYGPPPGYHDTLVLSTPDGRLRDATAGIPQQSDYTHSGAAADVDGDGDIDLFIGNIGGNLGGSGSCCDIQIWLNDGRGRFTVSPNRLPAAFGTDNVFTSSGFVDANGDGAPDLVLAGGHGCLAFGEHRNDQQVLLNDGRGTFHVLNGALPQKPFGISGEGQAVQVAELNHDGRPDLLIPYTSSGQLRPGDCTNDPVRGRYIQALVANGDGTFHDETSIRLPQPDAHESSYDFVQALELVDLDGDGSPELFTQLVTPPYGDRTPASAYRNDGNGHFTQLPTGYPFRDTEPSVHALVDLFGNGHRDIVTVHFDFGGDLFLGRLQLGKPISPGTPTDVRVTTDPTTGRRVVAWPYVWGATRYEVSRSGRRIGMTKLMRYVDTAPIPGSVYTVRAVNRAGKSAFSAAVATPAD